MRAASNVSAKSAASAGSKGKAKAAPKKQKVASESDSDSSSESAKPAPKKAAKKAASSSDSDSGSDSSSAKPAKKAPAKKAASSDGSDSDSGSAKAEAPAATEAEATPAAADAGEHAGKTELFVQGLAFETSEYSLRAFFETHGELVKCKLLKGKAFIEYTEHAAALKARDATNEQELDGKQIWVEFSGQAAGGYNANSGNEEATTVFVGNLGFRTE